MRPQSSQLAEPLWTDSGLKSRISECELISKCMQGRNGQTSPKKPPFQTSILPEVQVQVTPKHAYAFDPTQSELADYAAVRA